MITAHYIVMSRRNSAGEDYVTFVLGPFPTFEALQIAGEAFVNWYRAKFPGDLEAYLEPVTYSAYRLPLGRCNEMYGFRPFGSDPSPVPLFGN